MAKYCRLGGMTGWFQCNTSNFMSLSGCVWLRTTLRFIPASLVCDFAQLLLNSMTNYASSSAIAERPRDACSAILRGGSL